MRTHTAFRHRQPQWSVIRTGLPRFARSDGPCAREVGGIVPHAGLPRFTRSDDLCVHRVMRWAAQPAELSHCAISVGSSCHREERSDVAIHDFFGGMCQDEHILGVTAC